MKYRCETCGDQATQWDYDQFMYFCDRHVQQADFTVPLEEKMPNDIDVPCADDH